MVVNLQPVPDTGSESGAVSSSAPITGSGVLLTSAVLTGFSSHLINIHNKVLYCSQFLGTSRGLRALVGQKLWTMTKCISYKSSCQKRFTSFFDVLPGSTPQKPHRVSISTTLVTLNPARGRSCSPYPVHIFRGDAGVIHLSCPLRVPVPEMPGDLNTCSARTRVTKQ